MIIHRLCASRSGHIIQGCKSHHLRVQGPKVTWFKRRIVPGTYARKNLQGWHLYLKWMFCKKFGGQFPLRMITSLRYAPRELLVIIHLGVHESHTNFLVVLIPNSIHLGPHQDPCCLACSSTPRETIHHK